MSVRVENMSMPEVRMVAEAAERFNRAVYGELRKEKGNILISPHGVAAVLAMVAEGAKGETRQMMERLMFLPGRTAVQQGYKDLIRSLRTDFTLLILHNEHSFKRDRQLQANESFVLDVATAGFVMKGYHLEMAFRQILRSFYHTQIKELDFHNSKKAARAINEWVETNTDDMFDEIVAPDLDLTGNTMLYLFSAVYFKGDFQSPFNAALTKPAQFWVSEHQSVEVQMMQQTAEMIYAAVEELGCSIVELPYGTGRMVMQVLVPHETLGVAKLEEKMVKTKLQDLINNKIQLVTVELSLPRFRLSLGLRLSQVLKGLGMEDLFSADKADLSGITGSRLLHVTEVKQRVFLQVTEGDSKAAASPGVKTEASDGPVMEVTADRPFIFLVRDTLTGCLLYQGRVVNPLDQPVMEDSKL